MGLYINYATRWVVCAHCGEKIPKGVTHVVTYGSRSVNRICHKCLLVLYVKTGVNNTSETVTLFLRENELEIKT